LLTAIGAAATVAIMRRIFFLFLLMSACDSHSNGGSKDMAMSMADLAGDGGSSCGAEGAACTLTTGAKGLCKSGTCAVCVTATDDLACETAYGQPKMPYICLASTCAPGCRTSTDCAGQICGLTTTNVCSPCTTDAQCQMAVGNDKICETATGNCVSSACSTVSTACTANSADVCCASGGTDTCVAGDCCTAADCASSAAGKSCVNNHCTSCASPAPGVLVVDPSEAANSAATGADVAGCRFKTITLAVQSNPAPGTTIRVVGTQVLTGDSTSCTANTGECFPIAVKSGISIIGDSTMPPTVNPSPNASVGFAMGAGGARLSNLTIDGTNGAIIGGNHAVTVLAASPSPSPAPQLDNLTIQNFNESGVQLNFGTLVIGAGVNITKCDIGLEMPTSAHSAASIFSSTTPTTISGNQTYNIEVANGSLSVTGTPGTSGAGTVQINNCVAGHGIYVVSPPDSSAASAINLNGVAIWGNNSDGVFFTAGVPLKMRNCYVLFNENGVEIASNAAISAATMALIDLGNAIDGHNTLQKTGLAFGNALAGICISPGGNAGDSPLLKAEGDYFLDSYDCTITPSPGPIFVNSTCGASANLAVNAGHTGYSFDTAHCIP
jgi:hypothetical protein